MTKNSGQSKVGHVIYQIVDLDELIPNIYGTCMIAFKGQGHKVLKRSIFQGQYKLGHVICHFVDLDELIPNMYSTCMIALKINVFLARNGEFLYLT